MRKLAIEYYQILSCLLETRLTSYPLVAIQKHPTLSSLLTWFNYIKPYDTLTGHLSVQTNHMCINMFST